jgi:hypothetical protein
MIPRTLSTRLRTLAALTLLAACRESVAQEDWHALATRPDPAYSQVPFWFWNEVTSSLANRLTPDKRRQSGLMGPVVVREHRSPR